MLAASYDNYIRLVLSLYIVGSMDKGSKCVFVRARNIPSVSIYFHYITTRRLIERKVYTVYVMSEFGQE